MHLPTRIRYDEPGKKALELYNEFVSADEAGKSVEAKEKLFQSLRLGEPMAHHVFAYDEFGKDNPRVRWVLRHYRAAANKGFAPSAWNLAKHYEKSGITRLYKKWMSLAARLGDPYAVDDLKSKGIDFHIR